MSVKHFYLVAVAGIIGCAHSSAASDPSQTAMAPRRANLVVADEIAEAHADVANVYDALARLRPNWLSPHGVSSFDSRSTEYAIVFVEGQQHGGLETLRSIPASQVAAIRYYDVTEAGATFGLKAGTGGVIEVKMKVRD